MSGYMNKINTTTMAAKAENIARVEEYKGEEIYCVDYSDMKLLKNVWIRQILKERVSVSPNLVT